VSEGDNSNGAGAILRDLGQYLIELSKDMSCNGDINSPIAITFSKNASDIKNFDDTRILYSIASDDYNDRRLRHKYFNYDIFGEPCWDILLDLFIARIDGLRISITSSCIASGVPLTTALRWLTVLENRGLIIRSNDQTDKRRSWVELSDLGFKAMSEFLREKARKRGSGYRFHPQSTITYNSSEN